MGQFYADRLPATGEGASIADQYLDGAASAAYADHRLDELPNDQLMEAFRRVVDTAALVGRAAMTRRASQAVRGYRALVAAQVGVETVSEGILELMHERSEEQGLRPPLGQLAINEASERHPDLFADPELLEASGLVLHDLAPSPMVLPDQQPAVV